MKLWERTLTDELIIERRKNNTPIASAQQPPGSRSQTWYYYTKKDKKWERIAVVHQYLRPDGCIGGWGRPDPKWVLGDDGIEYLLQP